MSLVDNSNDVIIEAEVWRYQSLKGLTLKVQVSLLKIGHAGFTTVSSFYLSLPDIFLNLLYKLVVS